MTYEELAPYLKGFYMALHQHLPQRDSEDWKTNETQWDTYIYEKLDRGDVSSEEAHQMLNPPSFEDIPQPKEVKCVPELAQALTALKLLFSQEEPPRMLVRSASLLYIQYGFADASGTGLGASVTTDEGIRVRIGTWGVDSQDESSNWWEFENLVTTLEAQGERGNLQGADVVMCTDNLTAEAAANKASSTSPKLYRLAVRLRALQFKHGAQFIISHVAEERMKDQGTDGVSRGHLKEGIAVGKKMLDFVPFHKMACDSSSTLKPWIKGWATPGVEFITPEGWFERGHDHDDGKKDARGFWPPTIRTGTFVWTPAPAAAHIAIEQLRVLARLKRQHSTHIVCIPSLLAHEWSRLLWKAADVVFEVPCGASCWPNECLESLTIGILFHRAPHTDHGSSVGRKDVLRGEEDAGDASCRDLAPGNFLQQLCVDCRGWNNTTHGL
jgi:hypothetical protein